MNKSKKINDNKNTSIQNLVNHSQNDAELKAEYNEVQEVSGKVLQKGQPKIHKNNLH